MKSVMLSVVFLLAGISIKADDRGLPEDIASLSPEQFTYPNNMHVVRPVIDTALVLFGIEDTLTFWYRFKIDDGGKARELELLHDPVGDSTLAYLATGLLQKLEFDQPSPRQRRSWRYFGLHFYDAGEASIEGSAAWEETLKLYEPVYGVPGRDSVDQWPEMIQHATPQYPDQARWAKKEGTVRVQVIVDKTGDVALARIQQTSGVQLIDYAAIMAAEKCEFTPARKDDAPVACLVEFTYTFNLTN